MANGDCRTRKQHLEREWPTDMIGSTDDDDFLAARLHADMFEHPHDPERGARSQDGNTLREAADGIRMETVYVFQRVNPFDHDGLVDVIGQRQLHEDSVDVGVVVQDIDQRQQIRLRRVDREIVIPGYNAGLFTRLSFVANVDFRRLVPAD